MCVLYVETEVKSSESQRTPTMCETSSGVLITVSFILSTASHWLCSLRQVLWLLCASFLPPGGVNTLHLPTSQGCCGDSLATLARLFKPPGSGVTRMYFILHCAAYMWGSEGKGFLYSGNSHIHLQQLSTWNTPHTAVIILLCDHVWIQRVCWKNLPSNFINHQQLHTTLSSVYSQRSVSSPEPSLHCGFVASREFKLPVFINLEKVQLRSVVGERESIWLLWAEPCHHALSFWEQILIRYIGKRNKTMFMESKRSAVCSTFSGVSHCCERWAGQLWGQIPIPRSSHLLHRALELLELPVFARAC